MGKAGKIGEKWDLELKIQGTHDRMNGEIGEIYIDFGN
jgi:hypothetical protein